MIANKDILVDEYCSSSSDSSIRSEFDDAYYNMKPPPPKFQDYEGKIVVIQNGQFQQTEAALQNLNLSNTTRLQSKVKNRPNHQNTKTLHSENKTFVNGKKGLNNATTRKKFEKGDSADFHTNRSNVEQLPNSNNVVTSYFYNKTNINTTEAAQQNQNVTTNENFVGRLNYAGALSNNSNAKKNTTQSQQCLTSQSNIRKSNTNNMQLNQHPTSWSRVVERTKGINQNGIDSQKTKEAGMNERAKQLPYQNTSDRSNTKPHQVTNSWGSVVERTHEINQNPFDVFSIISPNTNANRVSEQNKQLRYQDTTPISIQPEGNRLHNVPLPIASTSLDTISVIGRENTQTASKKLDKRSSEYSQTYNTFLAEQHTVSTVNSIQIHQPTISNSIPTIDPVAESASQKWSRICCFCFTCCD